MSERAADVIYDYPDDADRIVEVRDAEGLRVRMSIGTLVTLGRLDRGEHKWWCESIAKECSCGADRQAL